MKCLFIGLTFVGATIQSALGASSPGATTGEFSILGVSGKMPPEWRIVESKPDQVVLVTADGVTTVSIKSKQEKKKISEQQFVAYAKKRFKMAKKESRGPVMAIPPSLPEFVFYGGPKANGRVFAGYIRARGMDLIVVETEMANDDPKLAMKLVSDFIQGLKY